MKVLFVCHGNINRSAAAEIILRQTRPEIEVASCGFARGGAITARRMREALKIANYEPNSITSTRITSELITWADVVYYMDSGNQIRLIRNFGANPKFVRLTTLCPDLGLDKVPDPHFYRGANGVSAARNDYTMHLRVIQILEHCLSQIPESA